MNTEDLRSNWKPGHGIMFQIWETVVLQKATYRGKELSLRLCELDWRAPLCPSWRCSETDDNQSLTMVTYRRLANECRNADIYTGCLAAPSTKPNTMQITMPNIMPNTMTITIWNTLPYLFRSYITIPDEIPTQTWQFRATQLRWQLTTAIQL